MTAGLETTEELPPLAIEGVSVSKAFGGVQALDAACLSARRGEVHALVGENGAGKSTLIKILGGRIRPDVGEVCIGGRTVELMGPDHAHSLGVWTVFQELTLLPWMTVAENLLIRREPRNTLHLIDRKKMVLEANELLKDMGINNIDPRALVEDLSLAKQQIVEIVRVISQNPDTVLLDEPTSSLGESEVDWLFQLICDLRDRGKCIIFTSHRWNEITHIADRITIFRSGRHLGTFTEIDEDKAVTLMTGQTVDAFYPEPPALAESRPMLEVSRLTGPGIREVSFTLHAAEILGVGGLAGHGHRELFFSLFGAAPTTDGEVRIDGRAVHIRSPRDAIRHGIALVPEDRKTEGLILPMSVGVNLTLAIMPKLAIAGLISSAREREMGQRMIAALKIRTPGLGNAVGQLSGGNQQKVLLARWLLAQSSIVLLYDVTRGVDVATKHEIYELVMQLSREGKSVLLYSSDAEELAHLCHRVLVVREGHIAAELTAPGITAEDVVSAAVREAAIVDQ